MGHHQSENGSVKQQNNAPSKLSFLSQVNSSNSVKNEEAIKTTEEFVIENNSLINKFIFGLIIYSLLSLGFAIKWLIISQISMIGECPSCKIAFTCNFYLYSLANVILIFIYFRNLNSPTEKVKGFSTSLLGSSKAILALYFTETLLFIGLFLGESYVCTRGSDSILLNSFILAMIQSTLQLLLNCIVSMRMTRFFEQSKEIEEKQKHAQKTVEIFNASFCLNETKSEINLNSRRSFYHREKNKHYSLNRTNNFGNSIYMNGPLNNTNLSNIHSISTDITKMGSMLSGDSIVNFKKKKMNGMGSKRRFNHVKDFDIYVPDKIELH
jgi:hypothetical protein